MFSILDPRLWGVVALAIALSFGGGYFKGRSDGAKHVRTEWAAAVSLANSEARHLEQERQRRVDDVARIAAARAVRAAAANDRVAGELDGMRLAADTAERVAQESSAAAAKYASACTALLKEGGGLLAQVQRAADGHANDVQTLLDAWPK